MRAHRLVPAWMAALGITLALVSSGCSKKLVNTMVPNQPPTIRLTNAPVTSTDPVYYAYKLNWLGYDPDGRIASYEYCVDPPTTADADTPWVSTTKNEQIFFFHSSQPESLDVIHHQIPQGQDFHVFVIHAVDNLGARSANVARAFYSTTVAPTCNITSPPPSHLLEPRVSPAVTIQWTGTDPDGVFTQKPVKYRYKLFKVNPGEPFDTWLSHPDSLRRAFAPTFAGWDSSSADTTFRQYTNLIPESYYLFVVVAIDEAGAYSPIFSRDINMLLMNVGLAGNNGPIITLFNEFFAYTYPSGGFCLDPTCAIYIEVPALRPLNIFWFAEPPPGSDIRRYRWAVDITELDDETPRTNERTDLKHWSQWAKNSFGTILPPYPGNPNESHNFFLEAEDLAGLVSLGWVHFNVVKADFTKDLLVVDDTRLNEDLLYATPPDTMYGPNGKWPNAAELDTFLYAVGDYRHRMTPPGTLSRKGLFTDLGGYQSSIKDPTHLDPTHIDPSRPFNFTYDTLGTRTGAEDPTPRLSFLGHYSHIIWMVDGKASSYFPGELGGGPNSPIFPETALRYMTNPNKQNTLSSWITQGGNLWVLGGGIGNCTMATWNNRTNDIRRRIYTSFGIRPELVSGRFMFDVVHWRSEFMPLYGGVQTLTRIDQPDYRFDTSQPPQFPDNPFWPGGSYFTRPMRPEYLRGPTALNPKTPATDPLPPLRNPGDFYINTPDNAKGIDIEYLFKENRIVQDPDGVPDTGDEFSVLDTLYIAAWGGDGMNRWDYTGWDGVNPVMTVYRGQDAVQPVVFSGFNIWHFRRSDCLAMLDMVVNGMWQVPLPHLASSPPAFSRPTIGSALAQPGRVARPVAVRAPAGFRSPASAPVAPRRP